MHHALFVPTSPSHAPLPAPGFPSSTASEQRAIITLAQFLAGIMTEKGERCLPLALSSSISTIFSILNTYASTLAGGDVALSEAARFVHVCCDPPCKCPCGFHPWQVQRRNLKLTRAIKVLLFRHCTRPSLTRWTTMGPAMGYFALWLLVDGLGAASLRSALGAPGAPATNQATTHPSPLPPH